MGYGFDLNRPAHPIRKVVGTERDETDSKTYDVLECGHRFPRESGQTIGELLGDAGPRTYQCYYCSAAKGMR